MDPQTAQKEGHVASDSPTLSEETTKTPVSSFNLDSPDDIPRDHTITKTTSSNGGVDIQIPSPITRSDYPDGTLQGELSMTYSPKAGLHIQRPSPVIRPPNYLKGIPKNGATTLMLVATGKSTTGKNRFVVDTGATICATGNRNLLSLLTTDQAGIQVKTVDGRFLWSHGCGCVITEDYTLPNVHYVPGLDTNVVSISELTEQGYSFEFKRDKCTIMHGHIQAGSGTRGSSNLYELDYLRVPLN